MQRVNIRFAGTGLALVLVAIAMLVFAQAAQAQTPAEDQYGSPTDPSVTGPSGESGAGGDGAADPGDPASVSVGDPSGGEEEVSGGVLPASGGAPMYLGLACLILAGTGATLWLRYSAEIR